MRAVLQRVSRARVVVEGHEVGAIDEGWVVLLGVLKGDTELQAARLADKVAGFRAFEDEAGRMNLAIDQGPKAAQRGILVVSQFTLAADGRKGRRPSFDRAEHPDRARVLIEHFVELLEERGLRVAQGRFGAAMSVELCNQGPATFVFEEASEVASHEA